MRVVLGLVLLVACEPMETVVAVTGPRECGRVEILRGDGYVEFSDGTDAERTRRRQCMLLGANQAASVYQDPGGSDVVVTVQIAPLMQGCPLENCP